jgi:hypothetical protein
MCTRARNFLCLRPEVRAGGVQWGLAVQQNNSNRNPHSSVSAALSEVRAEANAAFPLAHLPSYSSYSPASLASSVRFPGEDGGRSLAEMAQRDLDAALQLLADRAQYITGATGAAIALRRNGRNDMLCRASSGANAPELGALLSTEFGLSGESVRTRQALRCDDAEGDPRVNHEVCRQMGIASVVVMPVVDDDEVLGVFELFSGKANAFGARDVSAVQRLSEMVETAVRLARAAEKLPEQLRTSDSAMAAPEDQVLDGEVLADVVLPAPVLEEPILEETAPAVPEVSAKKEVPALSADGSGQDKSSVASVPDASADVREAEVDTREAQLPKPLSVEIAIPRRPAGGVENAPGNQAANAEATAAQASIAASAAKTLPVGFPESTPPKNKLFWSAAASAANDAATANQSDNSQVPPMLRGLQKCEACGFPVSAGRSLCVECEEKKWKGRLNVASAARPIPAAAKVEAPASTGVVADPTVEADAVAAVKPATLALQVSNSPSPAAKEEPAAHATTESKGIAMPTIEPTSDLGVPVKEIRPPAEAPADSFVFSAGIEPSQSWLAANKYILGGLLLGVAVVLLIVFLR